MDRPDDPFAAPDSFAGFTTSAWRRESYIVGLVGPAALEHEDLIGRAGYQVVTAADGDAASELFSTGVVVDALVLDFNADGRPPEAVLLFARRTSAGAPIIALVPPELDEAYRRAFNAGARDVVPMPARGEDMLAAVDVVLEPRGLADTLASMGHDAARNEPYAPGDLDEGDTDADAEGADVLALRAELARLRAQNAQMRSGVDGGAQFRQQALDAVTERDRLVDARDRLKKKLELARRQVKDREAQLRLTERACEELQRKLRDVRTERHRLEASVVAMTPQAPEGDDLSTFGATIEIPASLIEAADIDPEDALAARAEDEAKLDEVDTLYRRYRQSLILLEKMRALLQERAGVDPDDIPELSDKPISADIDKDRRSAVQSLLIERETAIARARELERALAEVQRTAGESEDTSTVALTAQLLSEREGHAETLGTLDAVRMERDRLRVTVSDRDRQMVGLERDLVSAAHEREVLAAVAAEAESLRRELTDETTRTREAEAALEVLLAERAAGPSTLPSLSQTLSQSTGSGEPDDDVLVRRVRHATVEREKAEAELARARAELKSLRGMVEALSDGRAKPLAPDAAARVRGDA